MYKSCRFSAALGALLFASTAGAGHPLVTDDTGTQGAGGWQLELSVDVGRDRDTDATECSTEWSGALSYGLSDTVDLGVGVPYGRVSNNLAGRASGLGDLELSLKWRWYQREGVALAISPSLSLATGDEEFSSGRTGFGLNGIVAVERAPWTLLVNAGYTRNDNHHGERQHLWNVSTALAAALTRRLNVAFDIGAARDPDPTAGQHPAFAVAALIYRLHPAVEVDVGYRRGLNRGETDRTWGAGAAVSW